MLAGLVISNCEFENMDRTDVQLFTSSSDVFLATKILVLATKSENLEASWPQGFFLNVQPCPYILLPFGSILYHLGKLLPNFTRQSLQIISNVILLIK